MRKLVKELAVRAFRHPLQRQRGAQQGAAAMLQLLSGMSGHSDAAPRV